MSSQPLPLDGNAKFAEWQNGVERRLRALETGTRKTGTSYEDENSVVRVRVGLLPSGSYGIIIYDDTGAIVFQASETGLDVS